MDIITSGVSAQVREQTKQVGKIVKTLIYEQEEEARKGIRFENLKEEIRNRMEKNQLNFQESDLRNALKDLEEQHIIAMFNHHRNPLVRLIENRN